MKINLAIWDRVIRFIFGVMGLSWAISGGPWWAYAGSYLILTASWGICPVYAFFKIRTAKIEEARIVPE